MRPAELGELGRADHDHRRTQPGRGEGGEHVAGHGRAAHPADRDGRDALPEREPTRLEPDPVPLAAPLRELEHGIEHPIGVDAAQRRGVVQVDQRPRFRFAAGFSASSISITGIPSRTGYR